MASIRGKACEFLEQFHRETGQLDRLPERWEEVQRDLDAEGTYWHTTDELEYGARVAWRNSARCIGRLHWRSLKVVDRREAVEPKEIFDHCVEHLVQSTNEGRIRPMVTIFAPADADGRGPQLLNDQLVRYAGHQREDGTVRGDRAHVEITDQARELGWEPRPDECFQPLPLLIEGRDGEVEAFELPDDTILEVPIGHPHHDWVADMGLRWHALPAVSNMRLEIGGVSYPAAPFSGWYMATEIGARNFADPWRYNVMPALAEQLGYDTSDHRQLWLDRGMVEMTHAVLHSYNEAGVKITDHHTEARNFLRHIEREEGAGREVPADWSWIVPPISGGGTPVFHRYYSEFDAQPNFYYRCPRDG